MGQHRCSRAWPGRRRSSRPHSSPANAGRPIRRSKGGRFFRRSAPAPMRRGRRENRASRYGFGSGDPTGERAATRACGPIAAARHPDGTRRLLPCLVGLLPPVWLAGCTVGDAVAGTAINAASRADTAMRRSRGNSRLARHLKTIDELRAKGDPWGDYLWVVANAKGWVDNPELDPIKRLEMYQAASARGSADAVVAMGV